jgi:hypothetical protein
MIDNRVWGIADNVLVVDNRVAGIDDRVAGVDDRVKDVDDKVKAVDDKLVAVIDGAQYIFNQSSKYCPTPNASRWKRGQGNYPTNSRRRRSSETFVVSEPHSCRTCRLNHSHNYDRSFVDGFRHQIHLRITISHPTPVTTERRPGFSKEGRIRNGSEFLLWIHGKRVPLSHSVAWRHVITSLICSWLRQEHTLVRRAFTLFFDDN